jgi:hypothetical protein
MMIDAPHQQELLVRFQDKTHVVSVSAATNYATVVLLQLSLRTGWPVERLEILSYAFPFVSVRTISQIRGGKGGFGTLLKGASRQAGAKTTTDFGACRDLQGRRLRHVNDQLAFEEWSKWNQKVESGQASKEEMAKALSESSSGLPGWYLQLPSWAETSTKKEKQNMAKKFHSWKRQIKQKEQFKQQEQLNRERQVQGYVNESERLIAKVAGNASSALKEGLERAQKKQRVEVDPPPSLITLAGDVVLAMEGDVWRCQSNSNFCTVGVLLEPQTTAQHFYYEIGLITGGLVQVGWATRQFRPNSETGDGVGDCSSSFGYDGSRQLKLHNEESTDYGLNWKPGDIVGCSYSTMTGCISIALNGKDMGVAYEIKLAGDFYPQLFPAISCNPGEIVELRLHQNEMQYIPDGGTAIGTILASEEIAFEGLDGYAAEAIVENETTSTEQSKEGRDFDGSSHVAVEPLDLSKFHSANALEELGLDRLKSALMALGIKCGGTLQERAARLFSLKGLSPEQYPIKLIAKK